MDFLKGLVYGVVGAIAGLLLQRFVPLSYRLFPLFLYHFLVDHMVVAALLVAVLATAYRRRSVLEMVFFAGGKEKSDNAAQLRDVTDITVKRGILEANDLLRKQGKEKQGDGAG